MLQKMMTSPRSHEPNLSPWYNFIGSGTWQPVIVQLTLLDSDSHTRPVQITSYSHNISMICIDRYDTLEV